MHIHSVRTIRIVFAPIVLMALLGLGTDAVSAASPKTVVIKEKRAAVPYGAPVRISIPRINVNTQIDKISVDVKGILEAPEHADRVGWYRNGTMPGKPGNALISGHLNTSTSRAVFWRLKELRRGDTVVVINDYGKKMTFRVTATRTYRFKDAPLADIVGPSKSAKLNLTTCVGTWIRSQQNYSHRLVVYTELVK